MARHRDPRSTTARGYGWPHQRLKARLLATWRPGQPCVRCGRPMWDPATIDLGHTADRSAYTGLEHAACNRADGARRGNRQRSRRRQPPRMRATPSRW